MAVKKSIFLVALLSGCTYSTEIAWQAPTERENGDALYLHEIDYYTVNMKCGGSNYFFAETSTNFVIPSDVKGDCEVKLTTVDTSGLESVFSDTFYISVNSKPRPPFNIVFTEK